MLVNVQDEKFCHDQQIEWLKRMAFMTLSAVVMLPGEGQYAIKLFDEYGVLGNVVSFDS